MSEAGLRRLRGRGGWGSASLTAPTPLWPVTALTPNFPQGSNYETPQTISADHPSWPDSTA